MIDNNYCVYIHYYKNIPFYVGMGNPNRPFQYPEGRTEAWLDIYYASHKNISVGIVGKDLSLDNAKDQEKRLINTLSKKYPLTNSVYNKHRVEVEDYTEINYIKNDQVKLNLDSNLEVFNKIRNIDILLYIVKESDESNYILINQKIRVKIRDKCNLSDARINQVLKQFVDHDLIKRLYKGEYMVNPIYFSKLKYSDNAKLIDEYNSIGNK